MCSQPVLSQPIELKPTLSRFQYLKRANASLRVRACVNVMEQPARVERCSHDLGAFHELRVVLTADRAGIAISRGQR